LSYLGTLTRTRVRLALRNKMFFFFSVIMPLGFFFLFCGVLAKGDPTKVKFYLGPVLALNVMGSFWGLSATLVMFREQGILRRFHVTPVTATDMLASSVLANFSLTLPVVFAELFGARFIFHVHDIGNILTTMVLVAVGTVSFGSLGLVVASITNTMQETQILNQLLWLPMIFLSGATIPVGYLSAYVQHAALFLPATYMVSGLQNGIYSGAAIWALPVQFISLVAWGGLSFFVAAQLFRWEPETKIPRNAKLLAAATVIPFLLLGIFEQRNGQILADARSAYESIDHADRPQIQLPNVKQ
jgi:ABC-type transport system involved in cytochrome c biogenesis permease component